MTMSLPSCSSEGDKMAVANTDKAETSRVWKLENGQIQIWETFEEFFQCFRNPGMTEI